MLAHSPTLFYGERDHAARPVFGDGDGFINFGYWSASSALGMPTLADRRRASRALYDQAVGGMRSPRHAWVGLEMGCGQGAGLVHLTRARPRLSMVGVEISQQQVERARRRTAGSAARTRIVQASACSSGLPDRTVDFVVSVEAFQHFPDQAAWLSEARRVLVPGGRLFLATFFVLEEARVAEACRRIETLSAGLDQVLVLPSFLELASTCGFEVTACRCIGARVFQAFANWGAQQHEQWPAEFLGAYAAGAIDYCVVQARWRALSQHAKQVEFARLKVDRQ